MTLTGRALVITNVGWKEIMKFELARLAQYDNESIIAEIKRVAGFVPADVKLTQAQFDQHSKVSSSAIRRRFGGWQNALRSAGLAHRYSERTVKRLRGRRF